MRYLAPLFACCLLAATAASAQPVYVDADRTVAGGNPLNNGGLSTGAVRAFGSTVQLNGGDYATLHALSAVEVSSLRTNGAHLVALSRGNSQGHFTLTGNNFALTNATAGSWSDGYLNAFPSVQFRLTGTAAERPGHRCAALRRGHDPGPGAAIDRLCIRPCARGRHSGGCAAGRGAAGCGRQGPQITGLLRSSGAQPQPPGAKTHRRVSARERR